MLSAMKISKLKAILSMRSTCVGRALHHSVNPMKRYLSLFIVFCVPLFASCAQWRSVEVGEEAPVYCRFVGDVGNRYFRESSSVIDQLKKETYSLKGNFLECCLGSGAVNLQAESGGIAAAIYSGKAYFCDTDKR